MSKKLYADIIIDISSESLDKTYQYEIPEELLEKVQIGSPVEIPFGAKNRRIHGYIIEFSQKPKIEETKIKPICGIVKSFS